MFLDLRSEPESKASEAPWRTILRKTAEYFETRPWCQGTLQREDAVCLVGGVVRVARGDVDTNLVCCPLSDDEFTAVEALRRMIAMVIGPAASVTDWNDAPGRTVEEVRRLLREAAAYRCDE